VKVATWRGDARFTLDEAPDPVAGPGQVVVDVAAAGICGTDVHATQGLFPWTPPMIMGHEYSGVVRDVGRGVSRRLIGRAVACEPSYGCGDCLHCRHGRISQCARATRVGGFAERAALPVSCVHPLPKGLDPVTAEREQWDDGNNVVALEPGVVVAYERNTHTINKMREAGVEAALITPT